MCPISSSGDDHYLRADVEGKSPTSVTDLYDGVPVYTQEDLYTQMVSKVCVIYQR